MLQFFKNLFGVQVESAAREAGRLAVQLAPEASAQAQARTIADAIGEINARIATAAAEKTGLERAIVARKETMRQHLEAARTLAAAGAAEKANVVVTTVKTDLAPALADDEARLNTLVDDLAMLTGRRNEHESKLRAVRGEIDAARHAAERARIEEERAEEAEAAARRDANLSRNLDSLNIVSDALKAQTERSRQRAAAARLNAESIRRSTATQGADIAATQDADIAAALARAKETTKPAIPPASLDEEIAALDKLAK